MVRRRGKSPVRCLLELRPLLLLLLLPAQSAHEVLKERCACDTDARRTTTALLPRDAREEHVRYVDIGVTSAFWMLAGQGRALFWLPAKQLVW